MFWGGGNLGLSVTPQDVRMGKTFSRDGKTVENGLLNLTNLKSENIKNGVNIGGIIGNFEADLDKYIKVNKADIGSLYNSDNYISTSIYFSGWGGECIFNVNYDLKGILILFNDLSDREGNYELYRNGSKVLWGDISPKSSVNQGFYAKKGDTIRLVKHCHGNNLFIFNLKSDFFTITRR